MKHYWSNLPARHRGTIIITIPVLCLALTFGAWKWSKQTEKKIAQQVDRSQDAIAQSNNLLIVMLNAETGVRGYNISKDETFLEPYHQAQANLSALHSCGMIYNRREVLKSGDREEKKRCYFWNSKLLIYDLKEKSRTRISWR
jgi:CHASE3 domain